MLGVGCALLWTAFAQLYVPECSTFSLTSANPHCSRPVAWIYAGYCCAALGLILIVSFAVLGRVRPK